jgi:hypothetical protein
MIRETCKNCGMTIQAGTNEEAEALKTAMAKHVQDEHASPVAKHNAVLSDCLQMFSDIANGVRVSKLNAKKMCARIADLTKEEAGELPTDETLQKEDAASA